MTRSRSLTAGLAICAFLAIIDVVLAFGVSDDAPRCPSSSAERCSA
jgi:hypothetical protein